MLAAEFDGPLGMAACAAHAQEPVLESATLEIVLELAFDEARQAASVAARVRGKNRVISLDQLVEQCLFGAVDWYWARLSSLTALMLVARIYPIDLVRFGPVVYCVLGVLFLAGMARLVSVALYGWPAPPTMALLVTEIVLAPIGMWWHYHVTMRV